MSEYRNQLFSTLAVLKDREPRSEAHRQFLLKTLYSIEKTATNLDDQKLVIETQKVIFKLEGFQ